MNPGDLVDIGFTDCLALHPVPDVLDQCGSFLRYYPALLIARLGDKYEGWCLVLTPHMELGWAKAHWFHSVQ